MEREVEIREGGREKRERRKEGKREKGGRRKRGGRECVVLL
jgi:hypothetical protein